MPATTRREELKRLLALAAIAPLQAVPAPRPGSEQARDAALRQGSGQVVPASGIGRRIRHLSYSDQGGRPDGVQVMVNRGHVYVGHMFSDGVTILDATDPRRLKPVGFFTAGVNTRTHHLQVANDLMLLANGANIVAMQSYDNLRGYFENALVDSITNKKKFRSGLSIHDISRPGEMREIAFLEIPGFGVNRLSWMGGRYAYLSAHFDGFTDHIFCIVDLKEITKPEIVSRWWLPGMHRAGGEKPATAPGRRVALHHLLAAGDRGYGAWRDGGLTIHDLSDPASPKLLSHINWSPPFPGGTHTALPLPGRNLAIVADEANAERCAKGTFHTFVVDVRAPENPVPIATLPTPTDRDFCAVGDLRAAQPAREPARFASQRGDDLRDLQQRRRARLRHQGRVRAEGNRLVGPAHAQASDRSTPERHARPEDGGHLRDDGRLDVCERLERGIERAAVRRVEPYA